MNAIANIMQRTKRRFAPGTESSDLLSPLLVKELRQELRTRAFANFFLWPQLLLAFAVSMDLMSRSYSAPNRMASGLIWAALSIFLFLYLPRRAFISFQKEEKANSMELLSLTALSAWRIMLGKWIALSSQGVLFLVAILPYFLLDYLTSGNDLIGSLQVALVLLLGALVLLALGLSASAGSKSGVSPIIMIGGIFLVVSLVGQISAIVYRGISGASIFSTEILVVSLTLFPFAVSSLLLMGASRIASVSENYAGKKRAVGLAMIGIVALFCLCGRSYAMPALVEAALVFAPIYCSVLFEKIHPLMSKELARGSAWRVWLTFSGWPGGVVYMAFTLFLFLCLLTAIATVPFQNLMLAWILIIGGILLPRAVLSIFGMATGRSIVVYTIAHLILGTFAAVSFAFPFTRDGKLAGLFYPIIGGIRVLSDSDIPVGLTASSFLTSIVAFAVLLLEFNHLQMKLAEDIKRDHYLYTRPVINKGGNDSPHV